ncbi:damage-inducible mutagenesis protein [Thermaurantiacus tibetensis]|uniref:damage-inducible mutagenesis protein n=1 Tax=Thermaurantiacus tibetensis TaxID=2759035 RepID=UPI00188FFD18|nr:damage-inducible mutagenesis protein [Thermaurantiacus tibetensis]
MRSAPPRFAPVPPERLARLATLAKTGPSGPVERLPLGAAAIDTALGGGLEAHALHLLLPDTPHAHAATAFLAAHLAARRLASTGGEVLWATPLRDLFAPGLARAGLAPGRLVVACADGDHATLAAMEEAMGAAAVVVGEIGRAGPWLMTASRRLQLRCEARGTLALLLVRTPGPALPTAARTAWQVAPAPSALPATRPLFAGVGGAGLGPARLALTLARARGAAAAALPRTWLVDVSGASDAPSRLAVAAELAGGAAAARPPQRAGRAAA